MKRHILISLKKSVAYIGGLVYNILHGRLRLCFSIGVDALKIKITAVLAAAVAAVFAAAPAAFAYADTAAGACVVNAVTGEIVFERDSGTRLPMASTTKIMTLVTVLENLEPDEVVTISAEAASAEGSSAYISAGARMTVRDLCYGLMLNSGNDAAVALAEHVSGNTDDFAAEMTALAHEIGAFDTAFKNPNGLNAEGHYTTARDLAEITRYAMKNEEFREIVSTRSYTAAETLADGTVKQLEYINHNKLLGSYDGCIGVKTGYTESAGRCLVSAAERGGAEYIAVTLHSKNDWAEHREMLDLAFSGTRMVEAVSEGECVRHIVSGGEDCEIVAAEGFSVPVNGDKGADITVKVEVSDDIAPPLNKGEKVGVLRIYCGGEQVGCVDAEAGSDMAAAEPEYRIKPCFFTTLKRMIKSIFG